MVEEAEKVTEALLEKPDAVAEIVPEPPDSTLFSLALNDRDGVESELEFEEEDEPDEEAPDDVFDEEDELEPWDELLLEDGELPVLLEEAELPVLLEELSGGVSCSDEERDESSVISRHDERRRAERPRVSRNLRLFLFIAPSILPYVGASVKTNIARPRLKKGLS